MPIVDEIAPTFTAGFWLDDPAFWGAPIQASDDGSIELVCANLQKHLERQQPGRAINWLALGFRLFPNDFLPRLRRAGCLRPSKYSFNATPIARTVSTGLDHADKLQLPDEARTYLTSIHALSTIAPAFARKVSQLHLFLFTNRPFVLKGLLATVDYLFLTGHQRDHRAQSDELDFFSKEDIAEGLSYLIHLYAARFGLTARDFERMEAATVAAGTYDPYIVTACVIRKSLEWEILIDVLGYKLTITDSPRTFLLSCPDVRLAQSLRLGYIQTELQMHIALRVGRAEEGISIQRVGHDFYRRFGNGLVKRVEKPLPRFTYTVPAVPEFVEVLAGNHLFSEEALVLASATRELFAPFDTILDFPIYKDALLLDLIKLQRMANFLRIFTGTHLLEVGKSDRPMVFQSLIPRFTIEAFVTSLANFIPRPHAEHLVDFLSWQPGSGRVFDLQYQPLIRTDQMLTVPMNVLGLSNIIRNSLQLARERIHGDTALDPLTPILSRALASHSWPVRTSFPYRFGNVTGEVDVLAWRGRYIFAFECKNSLHPCSVHEIRTSIDHLRTAAGQLDRLTRLWQNAEFLEYLRNALGWSIPGDSVLITCIVTGNRMFTGYRYSGHPVRSIYELVAYIAEGTIRVEDQARRFWRGESFSEDDLHDYLVSDIIHAPHFESMLARVNTYHLEGYSVQEETFVLDALQSAARLGFDAERLLSSMRGNEPKPSE